MQDTLLELPETTAQALGTRYQDGYRVAGSLVFLGSVLKAIGGIGALLFILAGLTLAGRRF